jgi:hypothetical protein
MRVEISTLKTSLAALCSVLAALRAEVAGLRTENAALRRERPDAEVHGLPRRSRLPGEASTTSSGPAELEPGSVSERRTEHGDMIPPNLEWILPNYEVDRRLA